MTASQVKQKIELWLIDSEELVLYRTVSDTKESYIPIKDNPTMQKFICVSTEDMGNLLYRCGDAL